MQTTKKLKVWAAALSLCAVISVIGRLAADGQVPIISDWLHWNGTPPLTSNGGYTGFNFASLGETDFYNMPGGSAGGYCWYNTSAPTQLMCLSSTGVLTANGGFVGNLTGNVTGNASTATALAATPSNCGAAGFAYGIAANGNALCNSTAQIETVVSTTASCTTGSTAYASCSFTVSWPAAFADTNYAATCNIVPNGTFMTAYWVQSRTTTGVTVFIQNGDASGAFAITNSEVACIGIHS